MSGYNFLYQINKNYCVDMYEFFEETSINRVFIYKKNLTKKNLVEILDFDLGTEKREMLEKSKEFILELENLLKIPKKDKKTVDESL